MNADKNNIKKEICRLSYRITKTGLRYNSESLEKLKNLAEINEINETKNSEIINLVENLINF